MDRRTLLNLLLLAAVAGLGLLAWLETQQPADTPPPVTSLGADRIGRIEILRGGETTVRLQKTPGGWVLPGPPDLPADRFQVAALLGLLSEIPRRSYPAADLDLAQAGLRPPFARLRFDGFEILLGERAPLDGLRYLQVGERVYLVEDRYGLLVEGGRIRFASRRLLPAGADVTALHLPGLTLERNGGGGWRTGGGLSAEGAEALATAWQGTSAVWVKAAPADIRGEPIEIRLADGTHLTFLLARHDGERNLIRPDLGLEYHLDERSLGRLLAGTPEPPQTQ